MQMRQVLDCMDHGELTLTVLKCVGCSVLDLKEKKCIFLFLETIEVPTTMTTYVHTKAPSLWWETRARDAHQMGPSGCVFLAVQMLSTAYFSTSTMKCSHCRLTFTFMPLILFFPLQ